MTIFTNVTDFGYMEFDDETEDERYFDNKGNPTDRYGNRIKKVEKENEDEDKDESIKIYNGKGIKIYNGKLIPNITNLINLWDEIFEIYSFNNPEYSRACFHLVMGMILKTCRIDRDGIKTDPRISVLYIKPTFSGGSAGFDMVSLISKKLKLNVNKITDVTDAALIGSFEYDDSVKCNIMKRGILDKSISDLVYWGEASIIFQKNLPPYSMRTRNYLQMALNPIDSEESKFEKPMKNGTVLCDVECSLLLVTFPPKELDDEILYSGAVQRFCFIPKGLDIEGRIKNINEDIKRYKKEGIDISEKILSLVTVLSEIKEKYKNGKLFIMDNGATTKFMELEKELGQKYMVMDSRIQDHMGGILSSSVRKISAISMHIAAIRGDENINKDDIEYAMDILRPQLDMIHEYLESRPEHTFHNKQEDEEFNKVANYCGRVAFSKKDFLIAIGECLRLYSKKAQYKRFNSWINQGLIVKNTYGNIVFRR